MRRLALVVWASFALANLSAAQIQTWGIDPSHSSAEFAVRHLGISTVRGDFEKVSGKVSYDSMDVGKSSIEATIDATTINTRIEARDKDLRSPHFFDVEKYPVITFKSKRIESAGAGKLRVTGDLTMHGVTKEVVMDVDGPTLPVKDSSGATRMGVAATAKINRRDFDINGGTVAVGDEVQVTLDIELIGSPSPPKSTQLK
jgi:polyisoprenoid-binding protein YceI